ncbi:MAG: hypothetical protein ACKV19_29340 [Verrucomicrobiales bacterium]
MLEIVLVLEKSAPLTALPPTPVAHPDYRRLLALSLAPRRFRTEY